LLFLDCKGKKIYDDSQRYGNEKRSSISKPDNSLEKEEHGYYTGNSFGENWE